MKIFQSFFVLAFILCVAFPSQTTATVYRNWFGSDGTSGGDGIWSTSDSGWKDAPSQGGSATGSLIAWTNATTTALVEADFSAASTATLGSNVDVSLIYIKGSGDVTINGDTGNPATDLYSLNFINSSTATTVVWFSGYTKTLTINSNINIKDSATGSNNSTYSFARGSGSSGTLIINGNISITSSSTGQKTLFFDTNGAYTDTYNGSTSIASGSSGTIGMQFGSASTASGTYNIGGNNSGITGTVTISSAKVIVGFTNGIGTGNTDLGRVWVSGTGYTYAANESSILTSAPVTIPNAITVYGTSASGGSGTRVIGGQHTSGVSTFSGSINLTGSSASLTSAAGGVTDFSGLISGANGITKIGSGIVRLTYTSGAQGYSGTTNVNDGTLLVMNPMGNGVGSGAVSVGTDTSTLAYFGGSGLVSSSVTLNGGGALTPGNINTSTLISVADTIYLLNGLTWNSDNSHAGMFFQLGSSSDKIEVTGGFAQGTGSSFLFNISNNGGLAVGQSYTLLIFDSTTFTDANAFDLDASTQSLGIDGTFAINGSHLDFTVTAIPEPSTLALIAFGMSTWLGTNAFRRRKSR